MQQLQQQGLQPPPTISRSKDESADEETESEDDGDELNEERELQQLLRMQQLQQQLQLQRQGLQPIAWRSRPMAPKLRLAQMMAQ